MLCGVEPQILTYPCVINSVLQCSVKPACGVDLSDCVLWPRGPESWWLMAEGVAHKLKATGWLMISAWSYGSLTRQIINSQQMCSLWRSQFLLQTNKHRENIKQSKWSSHVLGIFKNWAVHFHEHRVCLWHKSFSAFTKQEQRPLVKPYFTVNVALNFNHRSYG